MIEEDLIPGTISHFAAYYWFYCSVYEREMIRQENALYSV